MITINTYSVICSKQNCALVFYHVFSLGQNTESVSKNSFCLILFNILEIIIHKFNLSLKIGTTYFSIIPFMYKTNPLHIHTQLSAQKKSIKGSILLNANTGNLWEGNVRREHFITCISVGLNFSQQTCIYGLLV